MTSSPHPSLSSLSFRAFLLFLFLSSPLNLFADTLPKICSSVRIADNGREDVAIFNGILASFLSLTGHTHLHILVNPKNTLHRIQQQQADVFLATWKNAHQSLINQNKLLLAPEPLFPNAQFTLAVPPYLAQKGLTSINDIPRFKKTIASTIFSIKESKQGQKIITHLISHDPNFADFSLSALKEQDSTSFIQQKIKEKQDFVILAWEPHIHNALFNLVFLAPKKLPSETYQSLFPTDDLFAVTHKNFPSQCPQILRLIHQLKVSRQLMQHLMKAHLINKKPLQKTFLLWLAQHKRFLASTLANITTPKGKNAFILALHNLDNLTSSPPE